MHALKCPFCGGALKAPPEAVGQTVECPHCQRSFHLAAAGKADAGAPAREPRRIVVQKAESGGSGTSVRSRPQTVRRSHPGWWVAGALLLLLAAGGGWLIVRAPRRAPSAPPASRQVPSMLESARLVPLRTPMTDAPETSASTPAPSPSESPAAPSTAPTSAAPAATSAPLGAAQVFALQWGGSGDDECTDLAARPDGRIVLTGLIASEASVPEAVRPARKLIDNQTGNRRAFIAELSADGTRLNWVSLFGADLIEPERLALAPDGTIYIGGKAGSRLANVAGADAGRFDNTSAAIVKVSADGSRVLWVRAGGPNQDTVTGLAVDQKGRVWWTAGTRGRGMAAYALRRNADGSDAPFAERPAGRNWAIDLHHTAEDLNAPGQFWAFYKKSFEAPDGYDYDGPGGWGPIRFSIHGIRQGGQIIVLPNGDVIVSGTMQYDFREKGKKSFPAFDLFLARYTGEGRLVWSTNLYQPGDSAHVPDQKAVDLAYSAATDDVYVLAKQHGSNVYRFKGDLVGDTGNLMISWLGRVEARTGQLKAGYYFHHSRNSGYDERGIAKPPPYPKLSGNALKRVAVDAVGRVYVAGDAGAKAWTTAQAWRDWPAAQDGGGNGALYVFAPDISRPLYATMIRGAEGGRSSISGLAVTTAGIWVGGSNAGSGFPTPDRPSWSRPEPAGGKDVALVRFRFP